MVNVYAVKIDENFNRDYFQKLLNEISDEKKCKIEKFYRYKDALSSLISELIIRHILINNFNLNNKQIKLKTVGNGKPILNTKGIEINFNCSHSGDWVVCAFGINSVGIDIESIEVIDLDVAKNFFSEIEYNYLMSDLVKDPVCEFYRLWTLKESYIKWDGRGLEIPLKDFSFLFDNQNEVRFCSQMYSSDCRFYEYELDDKYKIALCTSKEDANLNIINVNLEHLLATF